MVTPPTEIEIADIFVCGQYAQVVLNKDGAHIKYTSSNFSYTLTWPQMLDDTTGFFSGNKQFVNAAYKTIVFGRFFPIARKLGWFDDGSQRTPALENGDSASEVQESV